MALSGVCQMDLTLVLLLFPWGGENFMIFRLQLTLSYLQNILPQKPLVHSCSPLYFIIIKGQSSLFHHRALLAMQC